MQPVKDNIFLHSNVITNPSDHVKNATNSVGCFTLQPVQDGLFLYHENECKKNAKTIEDIESIITNMYMRFEIAFQVK